MSERVALLLIAVLAASSLLMVKAAPASAYTTPSVPEFTVKLTNHSSDAPTTYSIDPYTGENVTHAGSHSAWTTLDIAIKNQAYSGNVYTLSYYIRIKGHYAAEWIEIGGPYQDSGSAYTVVSYRMGETGGILDTGSMAITVYGQVDFQVQARIGNMVRGEPPLYEWEFAGEVSDWSSTQTVDFGTAVPSPEQQSLSAPEQTQTLPHNHEPAQTVPFEAILSVAIVVAIIGVVSGLLIYRIKRK